MPSPAPIVPAVIRDSRSLRASIVLLTAVTFALLPLAPAAEHSHPLEGIA
ncbi:hypothetical protein [Streptomyces sp. NPDC058603]